MIPDVEELLSFSRPFFIIRTHYRLSRIDMKSGLNASQAQEYAQFAGLILDGFMVPADHSIMLCERGQEDTYSKVKHGNLHNRLSQGHTGGAIRSLPRTAS
jgi:hypothetical protein